MPSRRNDNVINFSKNVIAVAEADESLVLFENLTKFRQLFSDLWILFSPDRLARGCASNDGLILIKFLGSADSLI